MYDSTERGPRRFKLPRRRWLLAGSLVAALAIAVPVAWATFSDVPPSNPFYNDINAIQGAGITAGCGSGNFCPTDNITRQAEAAFVHRAAPRVAESISGTASLTDTDAVIGSVTISVGGVSGNQFVKVDADVDFAYPAAANYVSFYLKDAGGSAATTSYNYLASTADYQHVNVSNVFTAAPGVHTYELHAYMFFTGGTASAFSPTLIANTATFGSTGSNALGTSGVPTANTAPVGPAGAPHGK